MGQARRAQLTICRELTRDISQYATKPPHVRVAERLPGTNVRDRINYVVARGGGSISDRAFHPGEWDDSKNQIDAEWYADQLGRACGRLLELCTDDISDVIHPDCYRVTATGQHGISRMFNAPTNMVWRKRTVPARTKSTQAKRQMTLIDVLRRGT